LIKQNKAAAAVPMLERLAIKHPDEPDVHPWLAQGYLATQRYAEARTELDTAIRLHVSPKSLSPMIQAFTNYYQIRGDFQDAEKLYQAAVRIGLKDNIMSERSRFYIAYADHDLQSEKYDEAAKHLQLAQELCTGLDEETQKGIKIRQADCLRRMAALAEMNR
jgi:tetratricopeptide (TPR) repeat protein